MESSDDAIISKDLNGIVTSWNDAAARVFGYTAEEIIGRSITLIIPPELLPEEDVILSKVRNGEKIEHFQTVRMQKSGRRIEVSLSISPVHDPSGKIVGAAKIARDITAQRSAEQAARRLAAIVESSDDAIVSKDLNGIVKSWNKAAERIFGWTADEIIGKPITTIIPPELHSDEVMILGKIRTGQRVDHFESTRMRKNGERLTVSLTVSPIRNQDGAIVGAAKIARDVTQQRLMETALRTSERLASVGRMAATVAHEINNPLEAITNYIYLAKHQPGLSPKVLQYLNSADHELARVAHIARQTLGFYRDNSEPSTLNVAEIVNDLVGIYERKLKYKRLTMECSVPHDLSVFAMPGELKQVLSNLISNAIDASHEGGRIVIRGRRAHDFKTHRAGIRISVGDTGQGIALKDRLTLFRPFFTTKSQVGTGLGLWITRDLLEKRGGHVHFRTRTSAPSGTVMSFFLPSNVAAAGLVA